MVGRSTNAIGNGEGTYSSGFGITNSGVIVGCCVEEGEGVEVSVAGLDDNSGLNV